MRVIEKLKDLSLSDLRTLRPLIEKRAEEVQDDGRDSEALWEFLGDIDTEIDTRINGITRKEWADVCTIGRF